MNELVTDLLDRRVEITLQQRIIRGKIRAVAYHDAFVIVVQVEQKAADLELVSVRLDTVIQFGMRLLPEDP